MDSGFNFLGQFSGNLDPSQASLQGPKAVSRFPALKNAQFKVNKPEMTKPDIAGAQHDYEALMETLKEKLGVDHFKFYE